MPPTNVQLRRALLDDVLELERLIELSARILGALDCDVGQIEGALLGTFGVDTQLVRDGTYFVGENETGLIGCGGWSRRRTLFGGDAGAKRDAGELDPNVDAAKIRAFFVHPDFARRGIGTSLLARCELEAAAAGFHRTELMATIPGVRLYAVRGYVAAAPIEWPLGNKRSITFVPMTKQLVP